MKIVPTRRTDYGIRALIYLASHHGERSKAAEIAEAMDIPAKFLHQVLQELQRGQLVASRPSRSGGYSLTRDPADISVLDIVQALEGPIRATECALRGGPCHWEDVCALHWVWSAAQQRWLEVSSVSNFETYQSNRLKVRFKHEGKNDPNPLARPVTVCPPRWRNRPASPAAFDLRFCQYNSESDG